MLFGFSKPPTYPILGHHLPDSSLASGIGAHPGRGNHTRSRDWALLSYLVLHSKLPPNTGVSNKNSYFAHQSATWPGLSKDRSFLLHSVSAVAA